MNRNLLLTHLVVLLAGIAAGMLVTRGGGHDVAMSPDQATADGVCPGGAQPEYWVAPMDASFRRDGPGKSPMGMDLVPHCGDADAEHGGISVPSAMRQTLGLRTAIVESGPLEEQIALVGNIVLDAGRVTRLHSRAEGWIQGLGVTGEGDQVVAGDLLYRLFSPKVYAAEAEFLATRSQGVLAQASLERLRALGYREAQISGLRRRGTPSDVMAVQADRTQTTIDVAVRDGQFVTPGTHLMTLAAMDVVWLLADVEESRVGRVREGQRAEVSLEAFPGETWMAELARVGSVLDPRTRTLPLRLRIENADGRLRPNMFARATLDVSDATPVVHVPASSVIFDGHTARVVLARGDGRFTPTQVEPGRRIGDRQVLLSGAEPGQRVVVQAQFLIDSESDIGTELDRMDGIEPPPPGVQGVIRELGDDGRSLVLEHGPIDSLGMPGMTMRFVLAEGVEAGALDVGDPVRFTVENPAPGQFLITAIERHAP